MRTSHDRTWIGPETSCEATTDEYPWAWRYPFWMWWNLLSLDAPTVVCLWAFFFVHALHISFHFLELTVLMIVVWIIYASDRLLDGLRTSSEAVLSDRHSFYARHRYAVLGSLLPITVCYHLDQSHETG